MGREHDGNEIAVIGMAGRFPAADSVASLWPLLRDGREAVRHLDDAELDALGIDPALRSHPGFVPAVSMLDGYDRFDAEFFGMQPREAEQTDPQHRLLLETAWHCLEDASCVPACYPGRIGVFAGATLNTYLLFNLAPSVGKTASALQTLHLGSLNAGDFLATRVAYKLDLTGPAKTVQTACSTSLVAIHDACQSLLLGECDTALAGAASVQVNNRGGYLHTEQGMVSPDGHSRPFDAAAAGTVFASGVAMVALKRLSDALEDGDPIRAVVLGSAINNDGHGKAGFTAPSVNGQADVVAEALATAGVGADSLDYLEAHGAGTRLGDPIEVRGLTKVFGDAAQRSRPCLLGTVKGNLGHLDVAAGITGLIKTVLSLENEEIPPTVNHREVNPEIDFSRTAFEVADRPRPWPRGERPRRAGVSSFGLGGTNAHVVLEEPPASPVAAPEVRRWHVVTLSARSERAVDRAAEQLADHLRERGGGAPDISDIAWTEQHGRHHFPHRRWFVAESAKDCATAIESGDSAAGGRAVAPEVDPGVVFMFPGMGPHYAGMARGLYAEEAFRTAFDRCAEHAGHRTGADLVDLLTRDSGEWVDRPRVALPLMFSVEYALAQLWLSWGITARAMIGHSVGEYVAAALAGVFSLPDAMVVVAARGQLFEDLPSGGMLTVHLSEDELCPMLPADVSLAAVNAPRSCAVSGTSQGVAELSSALETEGVTTRTLPFPAAAHSFLIDPVLDEFAENLRDVTFSAPRTPLISNVTGATAGPDIAGPDYWVNHLRQPVRFGDGVRTAREYSGVLLEVGPGQTLSRYARLAVDEATVVSSMRHPRDDRSDAFTAAGALGSLWGAGVSVPWDRLYTDGRRQHVRLPGYSFEPVRHWVDPPAPVDGAARTSEADASRRATESAPTYSSDGPEFDPVEQIVERVREVLARVSGLSTEELDEDTHFFRLGFDSVGLVEAGAALGEMFSVQIPIKALFESSPTIRALAESILETMPEEHRPRQPEPAATPAERAPAQDGSLTELLSGQVELMREQSQQQHEILLHQLDMLRGGRDGAVPEEPMSEDTGVRHATVDELSTDNASFAFSVEQDHEPLTPRQRQHLQELAERFGARTAGSKARTDRSRLVRANFRNSQNFHADYKELSYPIFARRGWEGRIEDVDGNEYVDLTMGFGASMFGHMPPFLTDAVVREMTEGAGTVIGPCCDLAEDAARKLSEITGVERVGFFTSGTQAVMIAIRLARAATGRNRIAMFGGSFHGTNDTTLVRRDLLSSSEGSLPVGPGVSPAEAREVEVLDYGTDATLRLLRERAGEFAAVLVEPVQSRKPDLEIGPFLRELRAITQETGTALIFDELITGFRLDPAGAQGRFGVRADLVTYGKVLGGGMPLGVIAGSATFMDGIDGGVFEFGDGSVPPGKDRQTVVGGTFCEHPPTMAAVNAVLDRVRSEGPPLQEHLDARAQKLVTRLREVLAAEEVPIGIASFSSILRFTVPAELEPFYFHLLDRGVYMWEGRTLFVSLAHTDADFDHVVGAVRQSIAELRRGGFLPGTGDEAVPLTEEQRQLWAAATVDGMESAYNDTVVVRVTGEVDTTALAAAFDSLVRRHQALRVAADPAGDTQRFSDPADTRVDATVLDFSGEPVEVREEAVQRFARTESDRPFDLGVPPLLRVGIVRCAPEDVRVVIVGHHLVLDGWSWTVLLGDLGTLYGQQRGGPAPERPAPRFDEYLRWRTELLATDEAIAALKHWRAELDGAAPPVRLPVSRVGPTGPVPRNGRIQEFVDADLYRRLQEAGSRQDATVPMVLLAVFELLVTAVGGTDDVIVTVPAAGQLSMGRPDMVGNCTNLLPVRACVAAEGSFPAHLADVRRRLAAAYEHQAVSLADLVVTGAPGALPLAPWTSPFLFNMDRAIDLSAPKGMSFDVAASPPRAARQYLGLNAMEVGGRLRLDVDYDADRIAAEVAQAWCQALLASLETVCERPDIPAARVLDALPATEPQASPRADAPWCAPGAGPAVVTPDGVVDRADIARRAEEWGRCLAGHGAAPGDVVLIAHTDLVMRGTAALAALQVGIAFRIEDVPPAGDVPAVRLMRADSASPMVVDPTADARGELPGDVPADRPAWDVGVEPGTAALSRSELRAAVATAADELRLGAGSRLVLMEQDAGHGVERLLAALAASACVDLVPVAGGPRPDALELPVDVWRDGPAECTWPDRTGRVVLTGGRCWNLAAEVESCTGPETASWVHAHRGVALGITLGFRELDPRNGPSGEDPTVPLERATVALHPVVGERPVSVHGVSGELCLSTVPGLRDVPIPSGLTGCVRADGSVGVLGADGPLRTRGGAVWPWVVEGTVRRLEGVADGVLGAVRGRQGMELVLALVLDTSGVRPSAARCREFLAGQLPAHAVPDAVVVAPDPLRDASGAPGIDVAGLVDNGGGLDSPNPPRTELEATIARTWAEVLDVDEVDVTTDFFAVGGSSLRATMICTRLQERLGRSIPLRTLLRTTTIRGLATALGDEAGQDSGTPYGGEEIPRLDRSLGRYPLSPAQQRLYFVEQLDAESSYVVFLGVRLEGTLSEDALRGAVGDIVARHATLRTRIVDSEDGPVQEIVEDPGLPFDVVDLSGVPDGERDEQVRRRADVEANRRFDLASAPLLRVTLLRLGEDEHVLLLAIHHIVSDGWSFDVMLDDLGAAYEARLAGSVEGLPELPVQYFDYAAWERSRLIDETMSRDLDYWRDELGSPPVVFELETDHPRPLTQSFRGAGHRWEIPEEVVAPLRALSRELGTTLYVTLLAAFAALLNAVTDERDVVVGSPNAHRTRPETEELIGFFVNMMVIRARIESGLSFRDLVGQVADKVGAADEHQSVPFDVLVDELVDTRDASRSPLFTVMFLVDSVAAEWHLSGLRLTKLDVEPRATKFDLSLMVDDLGDRCRCLVEYSPDLFEPDTVADMSERLLMFLRHVADDPETTL